MSKPFAQEMRWTWECFPSRAHLFIPSMFAFISFLPYYRAIFGTGCVMIFQHQSGCAGPAPAWVWQRIARAPVLHVTSWYWFLSKSEQVLRGKLAGHPKVGMRKMEHEKHTEHEKHEEHVTCGALKVPVFTCLMWFYLAVFCCELSACFGRSSQRSMADVLLTGVSWSVRFCWQLWHLFKHCCSRTMLYAM